ncbi:MAG TPA: tol-pal system protein YbgF [Methylophilaceae bacterium]|nr:tol-pal system protein YbgF [Methylophilaceae bacterium]
MHRLILVSACLFSLSQTAQAALFGDDEARKKIADLQQQVQNQNQAHQATLAELKKTQQALDQRLAAIEAVIKGQGLMDLMSQIDRLNQDLNRVKGELEVATHNLETTQQRQKDLYADVDGRLRKVESGAAPAAAAAPAAQVAISAPTANTEPSAEAKDFEAAQALSRSGKYKEAFEAYEKFLQSYPGSARAPEAQYQLGYTQFALKNYKASIATQQKLVKQYPDHAKVPDAMFNVANSQIQLADIEGAKKTLRTLLYQFPNSEVAPSAKKRLAVLDSIKSK